jgi:hypothetical protein
MEDHVRGMLMWRSTPHSTLMLMVRGLSGWLISDSMRSMFLSLAPCVVLSTSTLWSHRFTPSCQSLIAFIAFFAPPWLLGLEITPLVLSTSGTSSSTMLIISHFASSTISWLRFSTSPRLLFAVVAKHLRLWWWLRKCQEESLWRMSSLPT